MEGRAKGYGPHKTLYNRFMRWSGSASLIAFSRRSRPGATAGAHHDQLDASESAPHGGELLKKGLFPSYRAQERRPELQAPCRLRRRGQTGRHAADRRPDERSQGRAADARRPTEGDNRLPTAAMTALVFKGIVGYSFPVSKESSGLAHWPQTVFRSSSMGQWRSNGDRLRRSMSREPSVRFRLLNSRRRRGDATGGGDAAVAISGAIRAGRPSAGGRKPRDRHRCKASRRPTHRMPT